MNHRFVKYHQLEIDRQKIPLKTYFENRIKNEQEKRDKAIAEAKVIIRDFRRQGKIINLESWVNVAEELSLIGYEKSFSIDVVANIVQELGSRLRGIWQIDYQS